MKYKGSCHCKSVSFEVETDLSSVIECNCSHCQMKSLLLTFVPAHQFISISGDNDQILYKFNKHVIDHLFCKKCGVESYAKGKGPDGSQTVAINIRTLEGVELNNITLTPYDGRKS